MLHVTKTHLMEINSFWKERGRNKPYC